MGLNLDYINSDVYIVYILLNYEDSKNNSQRCRSSGQHIGSKEILHVMK